MRGRSLLYRLGCRVLAGGGLKGSTPANSPNNGCDVKCTVAVRSRKVRGVTVAISREDG